MSYRMDFSVRTDPSALESTALVEVVPGRYDGPHWRSDGIFVDEEAFEFAEGIIARHFPTYDHCGPNEIPREVGLQVAAEWRAVAASLFSLRPKQGVEALMAPGVPGATMSETLGAQRQDIIEMLEQLATRVERFYDHHEYIAVLGV